MSKQSEAKLAQNYRVKPNSCSNCSNLQCDMVEVAYSPWSRSQVWDNRKMAWFEAKGFRCGLGSFAVKKTATCDRHSLREGGAA